MRIGIDATAMCENEGTGMQSYSFNLTKNLLEIDNKNEYVVYCRKEVPKVLQKYTNKVTFKICNFQSRKICEQLWLARAWQKESIDILHCICSLPLVAPTNSVLTVHGLSWRIYPDVFTKLLRWYWIATAERTMKKAKRLISISEWTKAVVQRHLGIPGEKIEVVHHGVNLETFSKISSPTVIADVKARHKLPERFILYLGALIPVKNIPTLIRAFHLLIQDKKFREYSLVIAGGKGWGYQLIFELVNSLKLEGKVIFTGFFPAEDLPALYNAAEVFVLPSLYEGFGLPILESFACGTPVITSNASCLPEIGGDAAEYFDLRDVDGLVALMKRTLAEITVRQKMIEEGLKRVQEFTWEKTAMKTLKVYENAFVEC